MMNINFKFRILIPTLSMIKKRTILIKKKYLFKATYKPYYINK